MPGSRYARGDRAWGLCQRCGLRFLLRNLTFDGYMPGLRVCYGCRDDRQSQEYPVNVTDPEALYKPAPDDAPWDAVLSFVVSGSTINLAWIPPDPSGAARYEAYSLYRAFSTDGINFTGFTLLSTFPVVYYGDNDSLADLNETGNPAIGNNGIESQTTAYVDTASASGYYQYKLTAQNLYGNGPASFITVPVATFTPLRLLEDGVTFRVLEDGVTFRALEQ